MKYLIFLIALPLYGQTIGRSPFYTTGNVATSVLPVAFDTVATDSTPGSGGVQLTARLSVASNSNRYLTCSIGYQQSSFGIDSVIDSSSSGTSAMSQLGSRVSAQNMRVHIYGKVAPETGNHAVKVYFQGTSGTIAAGIAAQVFHNVDQTTSTGAFVSAEGTSSTTATVNVSAATNDLVIDVMCSVQCDCDPIVGSGQTQRFLKHNGLNALRAAGSTEIGAATVTMSWDWGGNTEDWSIGGIALKAIP